MTAMLDERAATLIAHELFAVVHPGADPSHPTNDAIITEMRDWLREGDPGLTPDNINDLAALWMDYEQGDA